MQAEHWDTIEAALNELLSQAEAVLETWAEGSTVYEQTFEEHQQLEAALAAVQAERQQGQPVPDWSQAPAWAQWWAMDSNGEAHWFGTQPEWSDMAGRWRSAYRVIRASNDIDARQTLQRRPAPPAQE